MDSRDRNWEGLLQAMLDASPAMLMVVADELKVLAFNRSASQVVDGSREELSSRPGVLNCINYNPNSPGCGHAECCRTCVIRETVKRARREGKTCRSRAMLEFRRGEKVVAFYTLLTAVPFRHQGQELVLLSLEDIDELSGLWEVLPICSVCKKIRDDQESWSEVEQYFRTHHDMRFTHGYCPDCLEKLLRGEV
ncbi:hypothetical protein EDC39_10559 [Geothermobacter ehrlichii]|uniref:PAS domain-containing protein n=1 Tax=Geothermobacter ehrlichii TaxID=213224 RepID=A0A5D3WJF7_9BACT|nr:hypothetical protein [Geothermobacter ehrlichii]TYO98697.1 hypothetical protein EDC39_10559 [Geothermobacter ehrlichii]